MINDQRMKMDWIVISLMFFFYSKMAFAFQDIYEPDNSLEQAHLIMIDDENRQQHTLHSLEDVDWFKFYAIAEKRYRIRVEPVGSEIDVAIELFDSKSHPLLEEAKNEGFEGEEEFFSWTAPDSAFYFIKISDSLLEPVSCRSNIQYELQIFEGSAPTFYGKIKTTLIDAISGQMIEDGFFYTNQQEKDRFPSGFELEIPMAADDLIVERDLIAEAEGYQSLTCPIEVMKHISINEPQQINMPLLAHGAKIPAPLPSKTIYHLGETLHIEFPASLPAYHCLRYYFGIAYPDGRLFIISAKNQLELLTSPFLQHWKTVNYAPNSVLIDKPIEIDMPLGEYQLYTLRLPENVEDPINHLAQGELNMGQFRIEE